MIFTPNVSFNSWKIFKPSSKPGPRYECTDERLALSKEALNTKGMPSLVVTLT